MDKWLSPVYKKLSVENAHSDCCIVVGTQTFHCHKVILSSASDFFDRMFLSNFKETTTGKVQLKDVRPEVFEKFRSYVYTYDKNELSKYDNALLMELLECGSKWLVPSITADCTELLEKRVDKLSIAELIPIYAYAHDFMNKKLISKMTKLLQTRWGKLMNCNEALKLKYTTFYHYITLTDAILPEIERFNLVEAYFKSNPTIKSLDHIKQMVALIKFENMTTHEFYNGPGKSNLLDLQTKYEYLYKITESKTTPGVQVKVLRCTVCSRRMEPRCCHGLPLVTLATGSMN